ncbi:MAG TPA: glycosyltransferase family 39 protein [Ktedonobacteraceae bacterium]|nr:glycosyltransferase family 39 protein [Ktedonobacteraceae bacterium]
MPTMELPTPAPLPGETNKTYPRLTFKSKTRDGTIWQFLRFGLVGCLNTVIDLLVLNCLLQLWPAQNLTKLLLFNTIAYAFGALNSFVLNKYWTFRSAGHPQMREIARFVLITLAAVVCNDLILCFMGKVPHPAQLNVTLWTNVSKLIAIGGTVLVSYLGMRLWVFMQASREKQHISSSSQRVRAAKPRGGYRAFYERCSKRIVRKTSSTWQARTGEWGRDQVYPEMRVYKLWQRLALCAVMLVSMFVNFYQLGQNGFGNLFYAAGVRSMADNLHNFFFASYDPGGFVTIDKPPLGFWLQVMSVKIFGFTPFSIFLPQALAGVLAVLVLFHLVRRHFGATAGLLASLALALSPLSVVTARNNTIDSTLALVLLLGAWAILKAAETGKWRWLLLSAVLVGLGFNVKMLEAYLVIPTFGLLYLLAAPRPVWTRIGQLLVAVLVLLAVSLSWAVIVDLTPASQRPYVGSSKDNSEISLALGYNGIDRLLGHFGFGGGDHGAAVESHRPSSSSVSSSTTSNGADRANNDEANIAGHGGGMFGAGSPGPLRLFTEQTGGQVSWLLPIALLGILALVWQRRPRFQKDRQQQSLLLWGTWVLTMGVFFSVASFFHQYYMVTFIPAICALFGIGIVVMWQDYRRGGWRSWLLPIAILLTASEQISFIASNPAWGVWLIPLIAIPCALVALLLIMARLLSRLEMNTHTLVPALGLGIAALLLTPAVWSALPALQNLAISTPSAGPSRQSGFGHFAGGNTTANASLIDYLEANQGNAKYLVATPSSMSADSIILATNKPVMAMGGFAGADPILTTSQLASLVAYGSVHYFLLNNPSYLQQFGRRMLSGSGDGKLSATAQGQVPGFFGFGRNAQSALTSWVTKHCATVPASKWQSSAAVTGRGGSLLLYDCAGVK